MRLYQLVGASVALAVVAAACGDRGPDPSNAAPPVVVEASPPADATPAAEGDEGAGGGDGTTGAVGGNTEEATPAPPGPGDFGSLVAVCGPREGGGEIPALGDEEVQGLTDDAIALATIADPGFQGSPGLNQEIFDAAEAFVDWCNAAGGINGRRIDLTLRDAKLTDYQPVLEQACDEDFAIVGDGAVQDNLWADTGRVCGLIDVAGFAVTPQKSGLTGDAPLETRQVQPLPNPADEFQVGANRLLLEEFGEAGLRTAFIYANFQTLIDQFEKERAGIEQVGHEIVHTDVYNILGEDNWTPFAAAIKGADVQFLRFIGEPDNGAQLKLALAEVGFSPTVSLQETNFYDPNFLVAGGDAVEGDYVRMAFWPFEEAAQNPATQQYLDLVEAQGGKTATLGVQAMSAWLLFATLAKECDLADELSRTCILERAGQVTDWTGGGLHAPTSPATNEGPRCTIVLRVENGTFVRWAPELDGGDGYACDPSYAVKVEPVGG